MTDCPSCGPGPDSSRTFFGRPRGLPVEALFRDDDDDDVGLRGLGGRFSFGGAPSFASDLRGRPRRRLADEPPSGGASAEAGLG